MSRVVVDLQEEPMIVSAGALCFIPTTDRVKSPVGTSEFDDGAPTDATAALLYDNLDSMHSTRP
jgi:hypothetical protein